MTSVSRMVRRVIGTIVIAGVGSAAVGCAGENSLSANLTTLYIYPEYASPNVTVSVNGISLGTITQQYTGSVDCTVLASKSIADGVVSVLVHGGTHYSINWTFSSGKTDADSFDATPEFFSVPCLLRAIDAPSANVVPAGDRASRVVSGAER